MMEHFWEADFSLPRWPHWHWGAAQGPVPGSRFLKRDSGVWGCLWPGPGAPWPLWGGHGPSWPRDAALGCGPCPGPAGIPPFAVSQLPAQRSSRWRLRDTAAAGALPGSSLQAAAVLAGQEQGVRLRLSLLLSPPGNGRGHTWLPSLAAAPGVSSRRQRLLPTLPRAGGTPQKSLHPAEERKSCFRDEFLCCRLLFVLMENKIG